MGTELSSLLTSDDAIRSGQDLGGDSVPLWAGVIIGPGLDLGVQAVLVLVPEGRVTHQQDVEDHTWRSEVRSLVRVIR